MKTFNTNLCFRGEGEFYFVFSRSSLELCRKIKPNHINLDTGHYQRPRRDHGQLEYPPLTILFLFRIYKIIKLNCAVIILLQLGYKASFISSSLAGTMDTSNIRLWPFRSYFIFSRSSSKLYRKIKPNHINLDTGHYHFVFTRSSSELCRYVAIWKNKDLSHQLGLYDIQRPRRDHGHL